MRLGQTFRRTMMAVTFGLSTVAGAGHVAAQTVYVPRPDDPGVAGPSTKLDSAHLKDRPYSSLLPKPAFPSTERTQRQFTVQYIYDYAYSAYTPEVRVPILPRAQARFDTPEDALTALLSATRSGDYEAFLACWNDPERKEFERAAKEQKQDAAFWKAAWKGFFGNVKEIYLVDRIETMRYVILDARTSGGAPTSFPTAFKRVDNKWVATNELSENPILMSFNPKLAGVQHTVSPEPLPGLTGGYKQEAAAQQEFMRGHTAVNKVVRAAQ